MFPRLDPLCYDAECKSLGERNGMLAGGGILQYTRKLDHFSNPAPIFFAFCFNVELQGALLW